MTLYMHKEDEVMAECLEERVLCQPLKSDPQEQVESGKAHLRDKYGGQYGVARPGEETRAGKL